MEDLTNREEQTPAQADESAAPVNDNETAEPQDQQAPAEPVEAPADEPVAASAEDAAEAPAEEVAAEDEADSADESESASLSDQDSAAIVEAILFSTDTPLPASKIASVAQFGGQKAVKRAIASLNKRYEEMGCSFRIEEIGGGFQMLTLPEYHDVLGRLFKTRGENKLSQAALETLAIIAYRQPIIRADIEAIRGVASGEVVRALMEKQLVKIVGRAEVIGRPMLYGTTRRFLDVFGLGDLEDLPRVEELKSGAKDAAKPAAKPTEANAQAQPASTEVQPAAGPATTQSPAQPEQPAEPTAQEEAASPAQEPPAADQPVDTEE